MNVEERIDELKQEVKLLSAILHEEGFTHIGPKGEVRVHPAVRERHAAIALLQRLEAKLPKDDDEELDLE